jgi:hypothetical protein
MDSKMLIAQMLGIIGNTPIATPNRDKTPINLIQNGNRNKKCQKCGHKNKKCTCKLGDEK